MSVEPLSLGEVVERPHRVEHHLLVRPRDRVHDVVAVQALRRLARTDVDAHRSAQLVVHEHLVEHAEQQRIGGQLVEAAGLGEQRVDPLGDVPLEVVAPERVHLPVRRQLVLQRRDLGVVDEPLDDHAPLPVEQLGHRVDGGLVLASAAPAPPRLRTVPGRGSIRRRGGRRPAMEATVVIIIAIAVVLIAAIAVRRRQAPSRGARRGGPLPRHRDPRPGRGRPRRGRPPGRRSGRAGGPGRAGAPGRRAAAPRRGASPRARPHDLHAQADEIDPDVDTQTDEHGRRREVDLREQDADATT